MARWQQDEPPDTERVAELLRTRYRIDPMALVTVTVTGHSPEPQILFRLERPKLERRPRERFEIEVQFQGFLDDDSPRDPTAEEPSRWDATVDTLDALVGQLIEGGYAHRELPYGDGLEYASATFGVRVECTRPDIEAEADRILNEKN